MRGECWESFARHRLQRKPLVSDPGMYVPWCMSGSLTRGGGENVPGIPGACATYNFTYLARCPGYYGNRPWGLIVPVRNASLLLPGRAPGSGVRAGMPEQACWYPTRTRRGSVLCRAKILAPDSTHCSRSYTFLLFWIDDYEYGNHIWWNRNLTFLQWGRQISHLTLQTVIEISHSMQPMLF